MLAYVEQTKEYDTMLIVLRFYATWGVEKHLIKVCLIGIISWSVFSYRVLAPGPP